MEREGAEPRRGCRKAPGPWHWRPSPPMGPRGAPAPPALCARLGCTLGVPPAEGGSRHTDSCRVVDALFVTEGKPRRAEAASVEAGRAALCHALSRRWPARRGPSRRQAREHGDQRAVAASSTASLVASPPFLRPPPPDTPPRLPTAEIGDWIPAGDRKPPRAAGTT